MAGANHKRNGLRFLLAQRESALGGGSPTIIMILLTSLYLTGSGVGGVPTLAGYTVDA
jgi:hypothetical protein